MTTKSADGVALALSESISSLEGEARALALALVRLLVEAEPITSAAFAEAAGVDQGVVEELVRGGRTHRFAGRRHQTRSPSREFRQNARPRGDNGVNRSMRRAGLL